MTVHTLKVGEGVILPLAFCYACGVGLGVIVGEITGYEGPDYVVRLDHADDRLGRDSCNPAGSSSVWSEAEISELVWVL
ncbi:hypothetical protein ACQP10_08510 [Streptosporangium sandarakinum]|uniref:hypothetical protein n=1 Tax=Streptosporangium sandarakinum TaxID=1260955 RepID=UPI003D90A279